MCISNNLFSEPSDNKIKLETSGTGEVFASEMIMSFIDCIDLEKFPKFELILVKKKLFNLLFEVICKVPSIKFLQISIEEYTS